MKRRGHESERELGRTYENAGREGQEKENSIIILKIRKKKDFLKMFGFF